MPTSFPQQYSAEFVLQSTTTCAAFYPPNAQHGFGFPAGILRIENLGGVPIRFNLTSTAAVASTTDWPLQSGGTWDDLIGFCNGMSFMTTSTTSSTGADGNTVRFVAIVQP